jgi:hypothetical protein
MKIQTEECLNAVLSIASEPEGRLSASFTINGQPNDCNLDADSSTRSGTFWGDRFENGVYQRTFSASPWGMDTKVSPEEMSFEAWRQHCLEDMRGQMVWQAAKELPAWTLDSCRDLFAYANAHPCLKSWDRQYDDFLMEYARLLSEAGHREELLRCLRTDLPRAWKNTSLGSREMMRALGRSASKILNRQELRDLLESSLSQTEETWRPGRSLASETPDDWVEWALLEAESDLITPALVRLKGWLSSPASAGRRDSGSLASRFQVSWHPPLETLDGLPEDVLELLPEDFGQFVRIHNGFTVTWKDADHGAEPGNDLLLRVDDVRKASIVKGVAFESHAGQEEPVDVLCVGMLHEDLEEPGDPIDMVICHTSAGEWGFWVHDDEDGPGGDFLAPRFRCFSTWLLGLRESLGRLAKHRR